MHTVLQRSNGNVTAAAKLAERNRTDFYDLMRRPGYSAVTLTPESAIIASRFVPFDTKS